MHKVTVQDTTSENGISHWSHETHYCGRNIFIFWIWILKPTSLKHHRIFPCATAVSYNYSWDCMTTSYEKVLPHYTWYFPNTSVLNTLALHCYHAEAWITRVCLHAFPVDADKATGFQSMIALAFNMGEFLYLWRCGRIKPLVNKCCIIVIKNAKNIHICQCKIKMLIAPHI